MNINYGSYYFPEPSPAFIIGDEPIYVAGKIDFTREKIQLVGTITGSDLSGLSSKKRLMELALSNTFATLNVGPNQFNFCKPINLSFSDSDLTTILPYSVEFESFNEKDFSNYYGVLDPTDSWSYTEQDGRIVSATHTVSARGAKINGLKSIVNAKNFVDSRLNGFVNFSFINPDVDVAFLRDKTEEANMLSNTYSVTENYSFSTSKNQQVSGCIISANTQINYSKNSDSSITVNGTIIGEINGTQVSTGMFTAQNASELARSSLENSKSNYEKSIYEFVEKDPTSYNYEINEINNSISFSFNFSDIFNEQDEVVHYYNVKVNASKDSALISVSIDGEVSYQGTSNIFIVNELPEDSVRYQMVQDKFNTIKPYDLALQEYKNFYSIVNKYDGNSYLSQLATSENINKNPYTSSISYSYSYDNKLNLGLKGLSIDYTDELPITRVDPVETMGGFAYNNTSILGKNTVSVSSSEKPEKLNDLKNILNSYLKQGCFTYSESESENSSSISYSKSIYHEK